MSQINDTNVYNVYSGLMIFSFFSPIILAVFGVFLSVIFQNFKGFIYLGFLTAAVLIRFLFGTTSLYNGDELIEEEQCLKVKYVKYGNNTYSIFVATFTFVYFCLPMFINNAVNWVMFTSFLLYIAFDVGIKYKQSCFQFSKNGAQLVFDIVLGMLISGLFVGAMYSGGSGKYLFFNEAVSNGEQCSMPKKQTFRCSVYKNGELITSFPRP